MVTPRGIRNWTEKRFLTLYDFHTGNMHIFNQTEDKTQPKEKAQFLKIHNNPKHMS